jgi:hypothetical protein
MAGADSCLAVVNGIELLNFPVSPVEGFDAACAVCAGD